MSERTDLRIGDTLRIHGQEFMVTQVRLDETVDGPSMMVQGITPMEYLRRKHEVETRKKAFEDHVELIRKAKEELGD